jgi:hypothetical protein
VLILLNNISFFSRLYVVVDFFFSCHRPDLGSKSRNFNELENKPVSGTVVATSIKESTSCSEPEHGEGESEVEDTSTN